jgi:hypothetical protein
MNKKVKYFLYIFGTVLFFTILTLLFYNLEERIIISHDSGFYDSEFELKIRTNRLNCDIIYTTDGSIPNINNVDNAYTYIIKPGEDAEFKELKLVSYIYDSPIKVFDRSIEENKLSAIPNTYSGFTAPSNNIDKAFILRAAIYRNGKMGDVATRVYFIGKKMQKYLSLSVLSLVVSEDDLWDFYMGIYVPGALYNSDDGIMSGNQFQRGREWERPVYAEFFDKDGKTGFAQNMGIRIHGGTSRALANRSFRLYARSDYGESTINYPIFEHHSNHEHKRLKLRTSGQDAMSTYFRDALMCSLMKNTEVNTEDYHPVNLFINGVYWGIFNIRERFDNHYVERYYGIDRNCVEIVDRWGEVPEDYKAFRAIISEMNPENSMFFYVVTQHINLNSFLDNKIAEIFFGSWDIHWKMWRDKSNPESKWNWILWDLDQGMGHMCDPAPEWNREANIETNYLNPFLTDYKTNTLNFEFSRFVQNKQIRNIFINRFAEMMSSNLSKQNILTNIDIFKSRIDAAMPAHIERWKSSGGIQNLDDWNSNIDKLREFANYRHKHVYNHIIEYFTLEGQSQIKFTIECDEAPVIINNKDFNELAGGKRKWTCNYFKDIPIKLSVDMDFELTFDGWYIDNKFYSQELTIVFTPQKNKHKISAVFM